MQAFVSGLSADVVPPTPTLGKPFALHYNIKDDDVRVAFVKLERKHGNENSFVDLVLFDGRSRNITYLDTSLISITTATSNFSVGSNYLGYKGRRSLSLTFINAQCNDSGQYRWVMHYSTQFGLNRILESISNVTLNVQATLSGESDYGVTIQPGSDLKEGSALEVKCKADVGNHPNGELTMHYHFPNGTLYRFPTTKLKSERKCSFVQEVVLDLLAVSIKDNGTSFRCILQQGNHTEYVESNPINVLYPPSWVSISRSPDRQVYTEGENVVFNCTVATNPPSSIIWKINNSVVGTTPALFLHNIQRFNAGEYTCEAHYDNVVYTSYIRLSVKGHLTHTSTASLPVTPTAKNNLPTNIVSSSTGIPLHPSSAGHPTTTPATSGTCNDYPGYPCDSMVKLNLCADNYIAAVYCQNTCQRCDPPVIIGR